MQHRVYQTKVIEDLDDMQRRLVDAWAAIGSNSTWLDSTRLDTFDFVEPVEPVEEVETSASSETSRALPTWRTTNDLVQV